jgi:hypothetical protein
MFWVNHDLSAGPLNLIGDVEVPVANECSRRVEREDMPTARVAAVPQVQPDVLREWMNPVDVRDAVDELAGGPGLFGIEAIGHDDICHVGCGHVT